MNKPCVLLVEDHLAERAVLVPQLVRAGFRVIEAPDGDAALRLVATARPDIVLLDVMMPGLDGREVLRALRGKRDWTPVIMLTCLDAAWEVSGALDEGADDYVNKPFDTGELISRIRAVLRRARPGQRPLSASPRLRCGEMTFDRATHRATLEGRPVALGAKATRLLGYMLLHPDELLTRERLLIDVWEYPPGEAAAGSRMVDQRVAEIRRALGDDPADPRYIETVPGDGYRFVAIVEADA